ncbi:RNA polymerase sigma factor [Candidatus Peribacteria bacterium]|nr:RNA polymerase sigma factor [Candidatus Peribacteria bacterium]
MDPAELQSFEALYTLHIDPVYRYLVRRTRDRAIAEDLTSMTFMKALESFRSFNPDKGQPLAWLYRIARNTLIDHYRDPRGHSLDLEEAETIASDDEADASAIQSMDSKLVHKALASLKPLQREVVMLRVWEGLPYKEIARITGKSEGNCKLLFFRACSQLRTLLAILLLLTLKSLGGGIASPSLV